MFKTGLITLSMLALLSGCATTSTPPEVPKRQEKEPLYVDENTLILFALDAQNRGKVGEAVSYYDLLYKRTQDKVYEDMAMDGLMQGHYYKDLILRLTAKREQGETLSEKEQRYLVVAYLSQRAFVKAESEAKSLIEKEPTEQHYALLAEVYRIQKKYIDALATLEKGYAINYSENLLDKIAVIIYVNMNSPYEAIGRLQKHVENFGYSLAITKRLAAFYANQKDEKGLLEVYPHLYKLEPTKEHANVLIQLYWNTHKKQELEKFLEESGQNDELLLQLYTSDKNYKKAIALAAKLYKEKGDLEYLGQKAILMYEAQKNRNDKKFLDMVISDLTKVVQVKEEGYFLNYLGYCLINYDRDVAKGMEYIKRALALEPESAYFIDSLAWGYYKEGQCHKASELMDKVVEKLGAKDPEVKEHIKAINSCLKGKK